MTMWICSKCKKQIEDECDFCYNCGEEKPGSKPVEVQVKKQPVEKQPFRTAPDVEILSKINSNICVIKNILLFYLILSIIGALITFAMFK